MDVTKNNYLTKNSCDTEQNVPEGDSNDIGDDDEQISEDCVGMGMSAINKDKTEPSYIDKNSFIRSVFASNNHKQPTIICYTDE